MNSNIYQRLERIRENPGSSKDFLICNAGDGDMGGGISMPGYRADAQGKPTSDFRRLSDYLDPIEEMVRRGTIDVALLSVNSLERMVKAGAFENSSVGSAIRANDTTDIWGMRGSRYKQQPSVPSRSALIEHAMYGRMGVTPGTPATLTDLGLYSITFMNDADIDARAGDVYRTFRMEAESWGFKHFLEVFNPNVGADSWDVEEIGRFVNDSIVRVIAAVPDAQRPQFLKVVYNGQRNLEDLVAYDPSIIVGILGGGAGTTRDTFELLKASQSGGARVALFGRKINLAEDALSIVVMMRGILNGDLSPEEAVRAYHGELQKQGIAPKRDLATDLEISEAVLK